MSQWNWRDGHPARGFEVQRAQASGSPSYGFSQSSPFPPSRHHTAGAFAGPPFHEPFQQTPQHFPSGRSMEQHESGRGEQMMSDNC
jgi:hypothetical protein